MNTNEYRKSLTEYRAKLWDELAINAATNLTFDREEFLTYVSELLIGAEEIEDFNYVPYEGIGKRNKKIQIDGYVYSELDDCLSVFIATPISYDVDEILIGSEANKYIGMVEAFLTNAEFILQNAEESSPGYGFAKDVITLYKNVERYKIYLITDKEKSKNITQLEDMLIRGKNVECHIWDIGRLYNLAASSLGREEIVINFSELGVEGIPCMLASETEDYVAYLCNIPGMILANLYNKYGGRLLEGNVRSFLQIKGKVNKGIRATILNEPDMFFAYNNGISATAYDIKIKLINGIHHVTEISSLQIVNGGQTTASLATALTKDKKDNAEEKIKKIFIPMKLSIITPDKAERLVGNISRYANSQNKVSDSDLWSNHPFHIRMEDFSRRLIAPSTNGRQYGTYWYYERVNGQYNQEIYRATAKEKERFFEHHPKDQKIIKTELAKYMHIYQQHPDIASAGGQKAFVLFATNVAKSWEKNSASFNEDYYKTLVALALLYRRSDTIVRKQPWYRSYKANIVVYSLAKIFHTVETLYPDKAVNMKNIWQKQDLTIAWINQIEDTAHKIYQYLIREDRGIENVTEWAKREACWIGAKKLHCELIPQFVEELQYKDIQKEERQDARNTQKQIDALNFMVEVVNYGEDGWASLLEWNVHHKGLSPSEMHTIQLAKIMDGALISSEKKCERVLKILEKCRVEGFPG